MSVNRKLILAFVEVGLSMQVYRTPQTGFDATDLCQPSESQPVRYRRRKDDMETDAVAACFPNFVVPRHRCRRGGDLTTAPGLESVQEAGMANAGRCGDRRAEQLVKRSEVAK